jgi:hypothetical protein
MTNMQRMNSDIATMDRREAEDKTLSNSRDRNDSLTQERRFEADKTKAENRLRNDELTANRRETKDVNQDMVLSISLFLLILLFAGTFLFLI